jgi:hypothetical protein
MISRALMAVALLGSAACAQVPANGAAPMRVLIRFQQPTPGDEPDLLAGLSQRSGVPVRFAAAVSERESAYLLACPPTDPGCRRAIAALAAWSPIERIDVDTMKRIQR